MKKPASNPDQLCLSIGKPLSLLLTEVHNSSRNPQLRKAAQQMQEALEIFAQANQTNLSKSLKAKVAIQEILTK